MFQQIVNAVLPTLESAAIAILTAVIGIVGKSIVNFIEIKKAAVVKKTGADEYNRQISFAKTAWGMVEEEFRIHPELAKTIAAKQEAFAGFIQKFIPGIASAEIETLRQAVAAEVNAGKAAITAPAAEPVAAQPVESAPSAPDAPASSPAQTPASAQ